MFVIVDDFTRFTWTLFLASTDETYDVFTIFAKQVQKKLNCEVVSIRSDHGTEFENTIPGVLCLNWNKSQLLCTKNSTAKWSSEKKEQNSGRHGKDNAESQWTLSRLLGRISKYSKITIDA